VRELKEEKNMSEPYDPIKEAKGILDAENAFRLLALEKTEKFMNLSGRHLPILHLWI